VQQAPQNGRFVNCSSTISQTFDVEIKLQNEYELSNYLDKATAMKFVEGVPI